MSIVTTPSLYSPEFVPWKSGIYQGTSCLSGLSTGFRSTSISSPTTAASLSPSNAIWSPNFGYVQLPVGYGGHITVISWGIGMRAKKVCSPRLWEFLTVVVSPHSESYPYYVRLPAKSPVWLLHLFSFVLLLPVFGPCFLLESRRFVISCHCGIHRFSTHWLPSSCFSSYIVLISCQPYVPSHI